MARPASGILALAFLLASCRTPDPQKELEVKDLETYYAIER
jgi:hypothetical protein